MDTFPRSQKCPHLGAPLYGSDIVCTYVDITWFPLEQVFRLISGDLRDSGEHMSSVHCSSLDTVTMIDLTVTGLLGGGEGGGVWDGVGRGVDEVEF